MLRICFAKAIHVYVRLFIGLSSSSRFILTTLEDYTGCCLFVSHIVFAASASTKQDSIEILLKLVSVSSTAKQDLFERLIRVHTLAIFKVDLRVIKLFRVATLLFRLRISTTIILEMMAFCCIRTLMLVNVFCLKAKVYRNDLLCQFPVSTLIGGLVLRKAHPASIKALLLGHYRIRPRFETLFKVLQGI